MIQFRYMKKRILSWFSKKDFTPTRTSAPLDEVVEATNTTLEQYSKTFKDLAKYDRRDKVLN